MSILAVIIWVLVLGFVAWLVRSAPFIDATFKNVAVWLIIVVAAFIVIRFLLDASGVALNLGHL